MNLNLWEEFSKHIPKFGAPVHYEGINAFEFGKEGSTNLKRVVIYTYPSGAIRSVSYCTSGHFDRDPNEGPAHEIYSEDGKVLKTTYYIMSAEVAKPAPRL